MYFAAGKELGKIVVAECEPGDNLIAAIMDCLNKNQIAHAVLLSGVATLDRVNYHYVHDCRFPPKEHHVHEAGAYEVSGISGFVFQGEPHIHFTAQDLNTGKCVAAHLEPDTRVLYVAEIVMAEVKEMDAFKRISYADKVILDE